MAGLRLESMINETLAGQNKKLTEMSGAVLDTIIGDTSAGKLIQNTLTNSTAALMEQLGALNGTLSQDEGAGGQDGDGSLISGSSFGQLVPSTINSIEMGQAERLFWVLIFSVMVLVAAGGNTIVVYIVATNKEMKSVTNYFLVNLSLADTMVSTLNVIFNFYSMLNSHWPFGKVYCKISNFIAILSISASVFTLTAISCDRYNAIIHPLRPRMSHRHAIGWILLIWTLSSALALPNFIYSTDLEDRLANDNVAVTCTMLWPDGRYPLSSYDHIYNIVILVVTYLVPILTMAILYYKVGKELWGYEAIGENIDKQQRAIMAKKKIVKMMIVVVIIFALCWLPYHAFFVVNYYVPTIFNDSPLQYQRCYLFMYWLAMSNSMYNPIIIYFMNSKFRHEFRKILCFICCCSTYKPVLRPSITTNAISRQQQQQQRTSTNHLQQASNNNKNVNNGNGNDVNSNLNGQAADVTLEADQQQQQQQQMIISSEQITLESNNHQLRLESLHKEECNNFELALPINSSIFMKGYQNRSEDHNNTNSDDDDAGHHEDEPFISSPSSMTFKPIVNDNNNSSNNDAIESNKHKDLNSCKAQSATIRNTDTFIDCLINNRNNNNIDTHPKQQTNSPRRDPERVWI